MIRFMLVDDHEVVRRGCIALLRSLCEDSHIEIIQAATGEEAIRQARRSKIDLAILDIRLPGISGIETARRIRCYTPRQKVLFFSMHEELAVIRRAIELGSVAYVSKSAAPDVFIDAVKAALQEEFYVQHDIAMRLLSQGQDDKPAALNVLTPREFEIFSMLSQGGSMHDIGYKLNLSCKTVSNYTSTIRNKLGVSSQAEMVYIAMDAGLVVSPMHDFS